MLKLRLDRGSRTPLYLQIVQAVRWRVGTGALDPGDALPAIRAAAGLWSVNYHTVRRAYQELVEQGWAESMHGSGTRIAFAAPAQHEPPQEVLHQWLDEVLETGASQFGLSPVELARQLRRRPAVKRVVMVECNAHESSALARQLEESWAVEAIPWSLEERRELPSQLPIIGTYFHHAEMRRRWPHRVGDMHFVRLELDPSLKQRLDRAASRRRTRVLRLVEQDPATAQEMAQSVATLVSRRFRIRPVVGEPDAVLRTLPASELLLVAPRLWDRTASRTRRDPRVFDVRHVIPSADLQRTWRAITPSRSSTVGSG